MHVSTKGISDADSHLRLVARSRNSVSRATIAQCPPFLLNLNVDIICSIVCIYVLNKDKPFIYICSCSVWQSLSWKWNKTKLTMFHFCPTRVRLDQWKFSPYDFRCSFFWWGSLISTSNPASITKDLLRICWRAGEFFFCLPLQQPSLLQAT